MTNELNEARRAQAADQAWALSQLAYEAIEAEGIVVKGTHGTRKNPAWPVWREATLLFWRLTKDAPAQELPSLDDLLAVPTYDGPR